MTATGGTAIKPLIWTDLKVRDIFYQVYRTLFSPLILQRTVVLLSDVVEVTLPSGHAPLMTSATAEGDKEGVGVAGDLVTEFDSCSTSSHHFDEVHRS